MRQVLISSLSDVRRLRHEEADNLVVQINPQMGAEDYKRVLKLLDKLGFKYDLLNRRGGNFEPTVINRTVHSLKEVRDMPRSEGTTVTLWIGEGVSAGVVRDISACAVEKGFIVLNGLNYQRVPSPPKPKAEPWADPNWLKVMKVVTIVGVAIFIWYKRPFKWETTLLRLG